MASEAELLALAERCEKAGGPDRELDELIAAELAGAVREVQADGRPAYYAKAGSPWMSVRVPEPGYTASLDAAMTLVPQGWWWSTGDCSVSADASCGPDVAHCSTELLVRFDDGIHVDIDQPSTPALALCSVALRARAATIGLQPAAISEPERLKHGAPHLPTIGGTDGQ